MTIEELVACDAATLEKMSDADLLAHFQTYLCITRPEQQDKVKQKEQQVMKSNPKLMQGLAVAKSLGIDMDFSLLTYRKKK